MHMVSNEIKDLHADEVTVAMNTLVLCSDTSGKHFIESVQELVEKACSDTKPAWPSGLLETQR